MKNDSSGLENIAASLGHIEKNLTSHCSVADMAEAANYSLFHFSRLFNKYVQLSPYDYLIRRRLSRAAEMLINSTVNIIDIALEFQFNTPEGFSRAFRRMFGINPSRYRSHGVYTPLLSCREVNIRDLQFIVDNEYFLPAPVWRDDCMAEGKVVGLLEKESKKLSSIISAGKHLFVLDILNDGSFHIFRNSSMEGDNCESPVFLRLPRGTYASFSIKTGSVGSVLEYLYSQRLPKFFGSDLPRRIVIENGNILVLVDEAIQNLVRGNPCLNSEYRVRSS